MGEFIRSTAGLITDPRTGRANLLGAISGDNQRIRAMQDEQYQRELGLRGIEDLLKQQQVADAISQRSLESQRSIAEQVFGSAMQPQVAQVKQRGGGLFQLLNIAGPAAIEEQKKLDIGPQNIAEKAAGQAQLKKQAGPLAGVLTPGGMSAVAQNEISGQLAVPRAIDAEGRAEERAVSAFGRQQDAIAARETATEGREASRRIAQDGAAKDALGIIRKTLDPNSSLAKSIDAMYTANLPTGNGIWSDMLDTARAAYPRTQIEVAGELSGPSKSKSEQEIVKSTQRLTEIQDIIPQIKPDMFNVLARGKAIVGGKLAYWTGGAINIAPEHRATFTKLRTRLGMFRNTYIQDMTGAAMGANEVERYLQVVPNEDDDDVTALAKAHVIEQYERDKIALHQTLLSKGIDPDSETGREQQALLVREAGNEMARIEEMTPEERFEQAVAGSTVTQGSGSKPPADPLKNPDGTTKIDEGNAFLRNAEKFGPIPDEAWRLPPNAP